MKPGSFGSRAEGLDFIASCLEEPRHKQTTGGYLHRGHDGTDCCCAVGESLIRLDGVTVEDNKRLAREGRLRSLELRYDGSRINDERAADLLGVTFTDIGRVIHLNDEELLDFPTIALRVRARDGFAP